MRHALALALCVAAIPATAGSVWVGGASVADRTQVGYLGRIAPLPGKSLSDGWYQSAFIEHVGFEYLSGVGPIEGTVRGIKLGIGREFRLEHGHIGIGLGLSASKTSLSPDDPGNANRGSQVNPVGELQWRSDADAAWRSRVFAQYVFGARRSYANAFLGRRLANGMALGPQWSTGGDPNYRIHGLALAVEGWRLGPVDLGVYAGAQHLEGGNTRPEFGISFSMYRND